MKRSRRELSIDMVIDRFISKNNQITVFPCFTFIPKTGMGLSQIGFFLLCSLTLLLYMTVPSKAES